MKKMGSKLMKKYHRVQNTPRHATATPSSRVVSTSVRVKNGGPFGIKEMAEIQIVKFKQKKKKPHENPA